MLFFCPIQALSDLENESRCWGYQEMGSSSILLVVLIIAVLPANGMPAKAVMDCPYSAGRNCQGLNRDPQHQCYSGTGQKYKLPDTIKFKILDPEMDVSFH